MLPKPSTRLGPSESLRLIFRLLIAGGGQSRSIPFQFRLLNAESAIDKCLLFLFGYGQLIDTSNYAWLSCGIIPHQFC